MPLRKLYIIYGVWLGLLSIGYFAVPSLALACWSGIGFSAAAAVVVGVIRNRPRNALPWLLVTAALAVFTAGDSTYLVLTAILH